MSQSETSYAKSGTQVFVGGMAGSTTEKTIREIFSSCGEILAIDLIKNRQGLLKGYCFVRFATKEAAEKAIEEKSESLVDGRKIGVFPSKEQDTLFLGNLHKGWDAEEFEKFVREVFPDVASVNLEMVGDVQSGKKLRNKGFGFVKFLSHAAAARAHRTGSVAHFVLAGNVHPSVEWAEEEHKTDSEKLAKIKVAYVTELPATADKRYMKKLFEPCGKVDEVVLLKKGKSQFGFIYFNTRQDLENALKEMNGKVIEGPHGSSSFKLQMEIARSSMDHKRKRASEDMCSKASTVVESQSTFPQSYLGVCSSGVPAIRIQKEVQHSDSYENAIDALPLAVRERILRLWRLGIASRFDIDEDCLFRLKELPESNAISVLDQFMLSGEEMQDKGAFLSALISKHLASGVQRGRFPSSREPVLSTLSRSDIYTSRYYELSSHLMLGRMSAGSTSDTTTIASIGNARGRFSSLTDHSPLHSTPSSYTGRPKIGERSPVKASIYRSLSPLRSIASSDVDNVGIGLNSYVDGPIYEGVSRRTSYGRVGSTYDAAAADQRTMERAPTSSIPYSRVASRLDEQISEQPQHQVRFDPYTGKPYRFDPYTGEPILPGNAS